MREEPPQVTGDAVVVEERVVDVEQRHRGMHPRIIRYPEEMRAVIWLRGE
jgi:hypothetical protein